MTYQNNPIWWRRWDTCLTTLPILQRQKMLQMLEVISGYDPTLPMILTEDFTGVALASKNHDDNADQGGGGEGVDLTPTHS